MVYVPEHLVREPGDPDLQSIYSAAGRINDNLDAIATAIGSAGGGIQVTTLTGEVDSLNTIDGDTLTGGEIATVVLGSGPARVASYVLNATSGLPENLPRIVTPLTNPGSKRWELAGNMSYVWFASAAPTSANDSTTGVRAGDMWVHTATSLTWFCAKDTVGAAVWKPLPGVSDGGMTACGDTDARLSNARIPVAHGVAYHTGQTCVESQVGFTASGGHAHDGTGSTKVDHANLLNKGSNDHAAIDLFIASKAAALGLASLGADGKVPAGQLPAASGSGLPDLVEATAGAAISEFAACYSDTSDSGKLKPATNNNTEAQADAIYCCTESGGIADDATGTFTRLGTITNPGWSWTRGGVVYLGENGAMTQTLPTAGKWAKPLGYADSEDATKMWWEPQLGWLVQSEPEPDWVPPFNDGRLELNGSGASLKWDGYQFTGTLDGSNLIRCVPASVPTFGNTDNDIFGNPLQAGCNYDVFIEPSSATAAAFKFVPWYANEQTFANLLPLGTAKMTANDAPSPNVVSRTSVYQGSANYEGWKAFSRTVADQYDCWATSVPTEGSPQRIMYDFGSDNTRRVKGYRLQGRNYAETSLPTAWTFQGSSNPSAAVDDAIDVNGWTTLDSQSGQNSGVGNSAWSTTYWLAPHIVGYQKYRLITTGSNHGTYMCIGNIHFILGHAGASQRYRTWAASTLYKVGSVVFNSSDSHYYYCKTEHTSGGSFDSQYWDDNGTDAGQPGLYKWQGRWVQSSTATGKTRLWLGVVRPHASVVSQDAAWVTSTAYLPGDIRLNDGALYICTLAHTSGSTTEPGVGASWSSYWQTCGGTAWDGRGVFESRKNVRNISNFYNKKTLSIGVDHPYNSDTSASITTTWVPWLSATDMTWLIQECSCEGLQVDLTGQGLYRGDTTGKYATTFSLDGQSPNGPQSGWFYEGSHVRWVKDVAPGFHFHFPLVWASAANTVYWRSAAGQSFASVEGSILA